MRAQAGQDLQTDPQQALHVSDKQYRAIWRFMRELRVIRLRGRNDPAAAEATRVAAAGLAAVGIPIAAVYVSGSVIGLSAAGITSGLAALGLGLGMVPGIGIAVLMGLGTFLGVRALLDAANQGDPAHLRSDLARRAQDVIARLSRRNASGPMVGDLARRAQDVIASLDEIIALLDAQIRTLDQAGDTRTTGFRLAALHERRRALQQIIARRRALAEATSTAG